MKALKFELARIITPLMTATAVYILSVSAAGAAGDMEWETYFARNNPIDATVYDGKVWLVSKGSALTIYDIADSSFSNVDKREGRLSSNSLTRVISDDRGDIWLGTSASGVNVLDPLTSKWNLITSFEGLPSDTVLTIANWKDSVWVGTPSGFAVFYGGELISRCNVFVPPASRCPLESFRIQAIAPLDDGAYLGTAAGVSWFSGGVETPLERPWRLGVVRDLAVSDGAPWVLTSVGVFRWDSGSSTWIDANGGLPDRYSFRRFKMIDGTIYAAGSPGIYRRDESSWTKVGTDFDALAVAGASEGGLWAIGTIGFYGLSGGEWTRMPVPGLAANDTRSVAVGQGGEVWVTGPRWAMRFDGENWEAISDLTTGDKLQTCDTYGLLVDSQNNVWFGHCCWEGTPDSCLTDRLSRSGGSPSWRRYDAGNIWRIAEGGGAIWLAGRFSGLYKVVGGESEPENIPATSGRMSSNELSSLAFAPGEGLWIGHRQEGVDLFRGAVSGVAGDWSHIGEDENLLSNNVRKILLKGEQLWAGTSNGVSVIDRPSMKVVRNYSVGPGGINDRITSVTGLAVDGAGSVWVTTDGGGVYVIDGDGSIQSFTERNSPLTDSRAAGVAYDPINDEIWITTSNGVNRIAGVTSHTTRGGWSLYVYPSPYCPSGCDGAEGGPLRIGGLPGTGSGEVVDLKGRVMARFFDAKAGDSIWDGTDAAGRPAGSGLYFVIVRSDSGNDRAAVALVR